MKTRLAALFSIAALQALPCINAAVSKKHKLKQGRLRRFAGEEALDNDGADDETSSKKLLAERDALKIKLAAKNREFLEQHRNADRFLYQLRLQRQREIHETQELHEASDALVRLSKETAAAAAGFEQKVQSITREETEWAKHGRQKGAHMLPADKAKEASAAVPAGHVAPAAAHSFPLLAHAAGGSNATGVPASKPFHPGQQPPSSGMPQRTASGAAQLRGETRRLEDGARAANRKLDGVTDPLANISHHAAWPVTSGSTLEKWAAYFASPAKQ